MKNTSECGCILPRRNLTGGVICHRCGGSLRPEVFGPEEAIIILAAFAGLALAAAAVASFWG